jgi:hypothetical protein
MSRFYSLDDANAAIPELRGILTRLRDQRAELIRLRDEVVERQSAVETPSDAATGAVGPGRAGDQQRAAADLRRSRLRMQGVIDQMQAGVARIDELGITLRDIESGLIDFPALVTGRQVWLCWRLGEDDVDWWHELSTGIAGRRPLAELE